MNLDLNIKLYKLSEKNIGENLRYLGLGKDFLGLMPKAPSMQGKTDKLDFIKSKNFCSLKDPVKRMKRQVID